MVPVRLPPLRERAADIAPLAAHFLDAACRKNRVKEKRLDPETISELTRYGWPGNVRELRNAMERVAILVAEETVLPSHLTFLDSRSEAAPEARSGEAGDLAAMMERHERALVVAALERNRWRMTKTAEDLGLERSHLYKKVKALGIEKPVSD